MGGAMQAVLFDLDGVVTRTARLHARAWKALFDAFLRERSKRDGTPFEPFDERAEYRAYVDGRPRYEGVKSFLAARDIRLPEGLPSDAPDRETVCGLGNRKNEHFRRLLLEDSVEVFDSTVLWLKELRRRRVPTAMVTSSRNGSEIVERAGLAGLFDVRVDGVLAAELELQGKPNPDIFLLAAERLGVEPARAVVVEDAVSGVAAGRAGGFGLVIGIDRGGNRAALERAGADLVVADMEEVSVSDVVRRLESAGEPLASALDRFDAIEARLRGRRPVVFLDYDGTLTPIVARPELAVLSDAMRAAVDRLAHACTTAIVSGRALDQVRALVKLERLLYAGNHGFEIEGPGASLTHARGREFHEDVARFAERIAAEVGRLEGAFVEDKRFSLSIHYRLAPQARVPDLEADVDRLLGEFPRLKKHHGKKVFEIRPRMEWDKGKAVLWLLEALGLQGEDVLPFYLGDDVTDEDAFVALKARGIGVLVGEAPGESAADYLLADTQEAQRFLERLAGAVEKTASRSAS